MMTISTLNPAVTAVYLHPLLTCGSLWRQQSNTGQSRTLYVHNPNADAHPCKRLRKRHVCERKRGQKEGRPEKRQQQQQQQKKKKTSSESERDS
ncbi:uncharacterized protein V6R79_019763 [Siganus canaliculatus]